MYDVTNPRSDAELIELIVCEVIRRLTAGGYAVASHAGSSVTPAKTNQELRLNERLVTLATLNGRLSGVSRVVVPSRAVVTPAVSEELRRQNISLHKD